eukprot:scaffold4079_cov44-Cyclotella_meneghiniana.AAC.15
MTLAQLRISALESPSTGRSDATTEQARQLNRAVPKVPLLALISINVQQQHQMRSKSQPESTLTVFINPIAKRKAKNAAQFRRSFLSHTH